MEENVLAFVDHHHMIDPGDTLVVGVSGGPDSMALLHFLWKHQKRFDMELIAAHVHHGLRGRQSDLDEELVADYCRQRSIPFRSVRVDVAARARDHGLSVEEAGRKVRYEFYGTLLDESKPGKIATGHHQNDQVETVLMRILRGTGIRGLRGMDPVRGDGVIRPFLQQTKHEILSYCSKEKIPYRLDESNLEETYQRNRIRHQLVPALKAYNPAFEEALLRLAEQAEEVDAYLSEVTEAAWKKCGGTEGLEIPLLRQEASLVQKRLIATLMESRFGEVSLEQRHYSIILNLLASDEKTTWVMDVPGGFRFRRSYDRLRVEQGKDDTGYSPFRYLIHPERTYGFPGLNWVLRASLIPKGNISEKPEKDHEIRIDYDKMKQTGQPLVLRQREQGDRFWNQKGEIGKKIKELFIEKKIPVQQRDKMGCFALGEGILWIPGVAESKAFQVDGTTNTVLNLSIETIQEETDD